jgi:hypothetical protein
MVHVMTTTKVENAVPAVNLKADTNLRLAAFSRVFGEALTGVGTNSAKDAAGSLFDQATKLDHKLNPVQRLQHNFKALAGSVLGSNQSIARDQDTLRMLDKNLYADVKGALEARVNGDLEPARKLYAEFKDSVASAPVKSTSPDRPIRSPIGSFDKVEQGRLLASMGTILGVNQATASKHEYEKVLSLYKQLDDRGFEKVRDDAAARFSGALQRLGVSVAGRAAAIATAPGLGLIGSAFGLGLVEAVAHQGIDANVRLQSGNHSLKIAKATLNHEVGALFRSDKQVASGEIAGFELGVRSVVADYYKSRHDLLGVMRTLGTAKNVQNSSLLHQAVFVDVANGFIEKGVSLSREITAIAERLDSGARVNAATRQHLISLGVVERDIEKHFKELEIIEANQSVSEAKLYELKGTELGFTQVGAVELAPETLVERVRMAQHDELDNCAQGRRVQIAKDAIELKPFCMRALAASFGNVAAVFGAAFDAARTSSAWVGEHQLVVKGHYAQLADYTSEQFAKVFGERSGLAKLPFGEAISEFAGDVYAKTVSKAATLIRGVSAFKEIFPTTGYDAVGKVVDISNPAAEFIDRTIPSPGETFASGNGYRVANFDLGQALWQRFTQGVAMVGEATTGIAAFAQTVGALATPFSKRPTWRDEIVRDGDGDQDSAGENTYSNVGTEDALSADQGNSTFSPDSHDAGYDVTAFKADGDYVDDISMARRRVSTPDTPARDPESSVHVPTQKRGEIDTENQTPGSGKVAAEQGSSAVTNSLDEESAEGVAEQGDVLSNTAKVVSESGLPTQDQFETEEEFDEAMQDYWVSRIPNRFDRKSIFNDDDLEGIPEFARNLDGYYADDITTDLRDVWEKVEFAEEYAEYLKDHDDPMTEREQYWYDYFKKHVRFVDVNTYSTSDYAPPYSKDQIQGLYHSPEIPEQIYSTADALKMQWAQFEGARQAERFASAKRGVSERVRSDEFRSSVIRGVLDADGNLHHDRLQPNIVRAVTNVLYRADEFVDASLFRDIAKIMYAIAKKPLRDGEGEQRLESIVSAAQTQVANAFDSYRFGKAGN